MDFRYLAPLSMMALLLLIGCASVDPRTIPQTDYDTGEPYKIPDEEMPIFKKLVKSAKKSISVQVDTTPATNAGLDTANAGLNLSAELQSALDGLGFLRTVSANDDLVAFVNSGYDGDSPADLPDYILLCRLTYVSATKDTTVQTVGAATTAGLGIGTLAAAGEGKTTSALPLGGGTAAAAAATAMMIPRTVMVKTYFEIYDRSEGATRYSKVISKEEKGVAESGIPNAIQRLFALAAKEYMEQIAYKIGPIGIVIKTTGGGRYAYISLGQEAGLATDGRVQFLKREVSDLGDLAVSDYVEEEEDKKEGQEPSKLGARESLPLESVADGHVLESVLPEATRAWVEVDSYNKKAPLVRRGMAVRLVPVPREDGFFARFGL